MAASHADAPKTAPVPSRCPLACFATGGRHATLGGQECPRSIARAAIRWSADILVRFPRRCANSCAGAIPVPAGAFCTGGRHATFGGQECPRSIARAAIRWSADILVRFPHRCANNCAGAIPVPAGAFCHWRTPCHARRTGMSALHRTRSRPRSGTRSKPPGVFTGVHQLTGTGRFVGWSLPRRNSRRGQDGRRVSPGALRRPD